MGGGGPGVAGTDPIKEAMATAPNTRRENASATTESSPSHNQHKRQIQGARTQRACHRVRHVMPCSLHLRTQPRWQRRCASLAVGLILETRPTPPTPECAGAGAGLTPSPRVRPASWAETAKRMGTTKNAAAPVLKPPRPHLQVARQARLGCAAVPHSESGARVLASPPRTHAHAWGAVAAAGRHRAAVTSQGLS